MQLAYLLIFALDLVFFNSEEISQVLVLLLKGQDLIFIALIVVKLLVKRLTCLVHGCLDLTLNQGALAFEMYYALLNQLFTRVHRRDLAILGL